MTTTALTLQVSAIFVIFATSLLAFLGMLMLSSVPERIEDKEINDNDRSVRSRNRSSSSLPPLESHLSYLSPYTIQIITSFSSGIILGVATCHLLAEGSSDLSAHYPDYPCKTFLLLSYHIIYYILLFIS